MDREVFSDSVSINMTPPHISARPKVAHDASDKPSSSQDRHDALGHDADRRQSEPLGALITQHCRYVRILYLTPLKSCIKKPDEPKLTGFLVRLTLKSFLLNLSYSKLLSLSSQDDYIPLPRQKQLSLLGKYPSGIASSVIYRR